MPRPTGEPTTTRSIRLTDELWARTGDAAKRRGTTVNGYVAMALEALTRGAVAPAVPVPVVPEPEEEPFQETLVRVYDEEDDGGRGWASNRDRRDAVGLFAQRRGLSVMAAAEKLIDMGLSKAGEYDAMMRPSMLGGREGVRGIRGFHSVTGEPLPDNLHPDLSKKHQIRKRADRGSK